MDSISLAATEKKAKCVKHGWICDIPPPKESIFIVGFVCKPYSAENASKHKYSNLADFFSQLGETVSYSMHRPTMQ